MNRDSDSKKTNFAILNEGVLVMQKRHTSLAAISVHKKVGSGELPHLSPAMKEVVKNNLKNLESQSDEEFLLRAEMDRKLSSL